MRNKPLSFGLGALVMVSGVLSCLAAIARAEAPEALEACNVVWDSPSANRMGSMPLGNGDISVNAWVEPSGDLVMLIGKTDSVGETGRLLKIGRVRVQFTPALAVSPFVQTLALRSGQMIVTAGQGPQAATVRVWVDANNPVIRLECDSAAPRSCRAKVELWRTREKPFAVFGGEHSENGLPQADRSLVELADTLVPAPAGTPEIAWYHRNTRSIYSMVLKRQHLEALEGKCPDPLLNRTFGAVLAGTGMAAAGEGTLDSAAPAVRRVVSVSVLTAQTPTAEAWLARARELAAKMNTMDVAKSRTAHEGWWKAFWDRSWIFVRGDGAEAATVTRGYTLHRYLLAACSRGPLPPKFNGATFTVEPDGGSPDYRRWGSNYWFQNSRWQDWPLPAAGDYDMMEPLFSMYRQALPLAKERTRLYYGHEGAFFPETMYFFGASNLCDFGLQNPGNEPLSTYVRWYWQGGIELVAMMLDRYDHTQEEAFARESLLPMAEAVMTFFDRHWKRGPDGKIRFEPAQSLETWHVAVNPMPEVAGLHFVLPRLLALPKGLATEAQRAAWARTLADLPAIPTVKNGGKLCLAPAETFSHQSNTENCELYAVFPYRLFGVGKAGLDLARNAFAARRFREHGCWRQNAIHAALVGDTDEARRGVVAHFSVPSAPQRFSALWDGGFDWVPDMDNGGTAMTALQYMVMQADGKTIRLLPAWPAGWEADFKLHAPGRTVVEGSVRGGKLVRLEVTPKSRAADVVGVSLPAAGEPAARAAADFHVAPGGSDDNPGTPDRPLGTIAGARDAVRRSIAGGMKQDVTVHLAAGNYFVETPVVFDDRDAGRDGHTIAYRGAPNLGTRIYGGRRITGWKKHNDTEVAADVPDLQEHFTLYENDRAANGGSFHRFDGAPAGNWRREGTRLVYTPRRRPIEDQVVVLGTAKDVFVIHGRSMNQIADNLVFDGLYMIGSDFAPGWRKGACYDTAWDGEYDGRPWGGRTLGDGVLAPDMRHGQFFVENARNVVIRNSKLYGAGFMGAIFNRWAQDNRVENCWIETAGCNGLFFMGWECGRGPFKTLAESYVNKKNVIRNNVFYDIGRFAFDGAGVYLNFSGDNLVEHNLFHGIGHYGVTMKGWRPMMINILYRYVQTPTRNIAAEKPFGDPTVTYYDGYVVTEANQGAELNHARNNVVRYNDFSQIARAGSDMGMISMWGAGKGNVWEYNALHDQVQNGGWEEWLHTLFNDDGAHNATLRGNVMYWIAGGGRSRAVMCKGNDQVTVHNILADSMLSGAATIGPYVEAAHDMVWSNNIVAAQIPVLYHGGHGTEMAGGVAHPVLKEAAKNVYYYQPMGDRPGSPADRQRIRRQVEEAARGGRVERGSVYADPQFDRKRPWWDADYNDYRLKPESPALKLGFQQTDMTKIGLREGYPFKLADVLDHPAGETWKAANFSRIYKSHAAGEHVRPYATRGMDKGAWTRYDNVNFGEGRLTSFRARVDWLSAKQTFETTLGGKTIRAMELGDSWCPIPYWEVSPVYTENGRKGPELMDVAFAPEKDPAGVKWSVVTEPLVSRATVKHPLGVINCDVANGETHANGAAYMRSSVYAKRGGRTGVEIRGAHGVKVWLDGQRVFSRVGDVANSPRVECTFKRGWNQFLVKVVQDDKAWAPTMQGWGNFWATVTMHYAAVGEAFILPGLPGKELAIGPHNGTAVEIRLGAPDGRAIGQLQFGKSTCPIEPTQGRHNVFLVFPNQNVQTMDWFRFE